MGSVSMFQCFFIVAFIKVFLYYVFLSVSFSLFFLFYPLLTHLGGYVTYGFNLYVI